MDHGDVERLVVETVERAGFDPALPVPAARLVRAVLGPDAIVRVPLYGADARLFLHDGRTRVAVRDDLPTAYAGFFLRHELGHYALRRAGYAGPDEERLANLFAGAATAPEPAMHALYRAVGFDLKALAERCGSTQTWAALRAGEALGVPVAVVTKTHHWYRGRPYPFEPAEELRAHPRRRRPGLARAAIRDAAGRTAWMAA